MNRKILLLISIIALASAPLYIVGCSSSDEQQSANQASNEDGVDDVELSEDAGATHQDATADALAAPADQAPAEGESKDAVANNDGTDDIVADLGDDPTGETDSSQALPDQAMGSEGDQAANAPAENTPPPADSTVAEAPPPAEEPPPLAEEPAPKPKVSLKKIVDAPFNSNGRILNTVYVARKGDKLNAVAEKLLGDKGRKKELLADNPFLSRGVKEGDKIYYNSPRRPDDTTTMMTYYEDNGVPAQSYTAKEGENIRDIAESVLGSRNAWKELWATNPNIESKGALDAGTEIRYWPTGPQTKTAANEPPPAAAGTTAPPGGDLNNLPPPSDSLPPPPTAEANSLPPPPPPDQMAANDLPPPPPPPPPVAPDQGMGAKKPASPEAFLLQDQETTMALGAGAIILLSVILIIVHRIKKSRAARMRLGQTQI